MADVFISYARADRAEADRLAALLEAQGLSVWCDRELQPGADFDAEIERELANARCCVVLWSAAGARSKEVRAEAREALARDILTPALIGPAGVAVVPPMRFRVIQHEDLRGWSGDAAAEPAQRLLIRIAALTRGQAAAASLPLGEAGASATRIGDLPVEPARGRGASYGALATIGSLALLVGALFLDREDVLGDYWGAVVGLACFAIAAFQLAEKDVGPQMRAIATRWLRPGPGRAIDGAAAFLTLFEAVFGRRHLS